MNPKEVCIQIRNIIKEKGYTQKEFSKLVGVSLPTLSRWLRGEGLLFQDLNLMLEKLDVKLSELAMSVEGEIANKFTYTLKQEEALANTEGLLAYFDQLLHGKKVSTIAKAYKLSDKSINFYLSKLDKLKLIEWLPKNKVKIIVNGEPSWIIGGPLSQKYRREIINEYIQNYYNNRELLKVGVYSLTVDSEKKISEEYQKMLKTIRMLEMKDKSSNASKKLTTVILGYGQNNSSALSKIPNL